MKKILTALAVAATVAASSCSSQGAYAAPTYTDLATYCGAFADSVATMARSRDRGMTLAETEKAIREASRAHSTEQNAMLGAARAVYNSPNLMNATPGQIRLVGQSLCLQTQGFTHE